MGKTREEKAITLIALIITIVVLLILAVVAINAVTGDGIIQHATNARDSYENAQVKEQGILSYYEEYITEQTGWKQSGTKVSKDGITLNVGDYVNYISNKDTSVKWAVLGAQNGKVLLVSTNLPDKLTLTGCKDAITKLNEACKDYDDGDYAVGESARSIKIEDIDRITGYNPLKTGDGTISEVGTMSQYGNKVTYSMDNDGKMYYELEVTNTGIDKSGVIAADGYVLSCVDLNGNKLERNSSITITADHYGYNPISLIWDENNNTTNVKGISKDTNAYKFLFLDTLEGENTYWLASIATMLHTANYGYVSYGARVIFEGAIQTKTLSLSAEELADSSAEFGVRAVVTLEADVNFTYDNTNSIWKIS